MGKHIVFKRVSIEGFGSFINAINFVLNRGSINLIKGKNGHGKTTIFSAFLWCLYKVNLKGLNNDQIVTWERLRPSSWRGTRVIVEWSIPEEGYDYMVARHIDFKGTTKGYKGKSGLMVFRKPVDKESFEPEDLVGDEQYKGDQQAYINRALGLDSKTFLNSVLFGQKMKRLIEADNDDKRKLFETLFDLDFVGQAKKAADLRLSEENLKLEKLTAEIDKATSDLATAKDQLEKNRVILSDFERQRGEAVERLTGEISKEAKEFESCQDRINDIEKRVGDFDFQSIEKLQLAVKHEQDLVDDLQIEAKQLKQVLQDDFNNEFDVKLTSLREKRNTAQEALDATLTKISNLRSEHTAENLKLTNLLAGLRNGKTKELNDKAIELHDKCVTARGELDEMETKLRESSATLSEFESQIKKSEIKINTLQKDIGDISTKCPTCMQDLPAEKIDEAKANLKSAIARERDVIEVLTKKQLAEVDQNNILSDLCKDKKDDFYALKSQLDDVNAKLKDVMSATLTSPESEECSKKLSEIDSQISEALKTKDELEKNLSFFSVEVSKANSSKDAEFDAFVNKDERTGKLASRYSSAKQKLNSLREELKEAEDKSAELVVERDSLPVLRERLRGINQTISFLKASIDTEKSKEAPKVEITALESKIFILDTALTQKSEDRFLLEDKIQKFSWWSKTGFGSNGLKAFVFNTGLILLNKACEKYASRVGVRMEFSVDLSKTSKPFVTKCYRGEYAVNYAELSGGQQARLNVATAFAMHDLISSTSNVNLLILDEIFESLDQEGIEEVFDLIRTKAGDSRTVYVVTHSATIDALNTKTIEIVLDDNENSVVM